MDTAIGRKRTIAVRKLISDSARSVLDVGMESMFLERLLPSEVQYYHLDFERHRNETMVCDLNAYEFPEVKADTAVLTEILEYLSDVDWLFDALADRVSMIVLSYKGNEKGLERSIYTPDELIEKLRARGFILTGRDETFKKWSFLARFQKVSPKLLGANESCTGCGAYVNICHTGALRLRTDLQGLLKPRADLEKCVSCNRCVTVCPALHRRENVHYIEPNCYVGWAPEKIRRDSLHSLLQP